jgi:6-phosphogluconolactonase
VETFGGASAEAVAAFEFTGDVSLLRPLNRESTRGTASCFVEVDRSGRCLLVANYSFGDVISYRIDSSGRLSAPVHSFSMQTEALTPAVKANHMHTAL